MSERPEPRVYGVDADGEPVTEPTKFVTALPAVGDFEGQLFYLIGTGWRFWDGSSFQALGGGGGGGAPTTAEYLVGALDGTLSAERLVTDTSRIAWDLATAGQAKADLIDDSVGAEKLLLPAAQSVYLSQATADVVTDPAAEREILCRPPGVNLAFWGPNAALNCLDAGLAGSSFPVSNVWDGRPFFRTDSGHRMSYKWNASISRWVSDETFECAFGHAANQTFAGTNIDLNMNQAGSGTKTMNVSVGYSFPWTTICVGGWVNMGGSSSPTYNVFPPNKTMTLAAVQHDSQWFATPSAQIGANTIIRIQLSGGTSLASCVGGFWFRRVAT